MRPFATLRVGALLVVLAMTVSVFAAVVAAVPSAQSAGAGGIAAPGSTHAALLSSAKYVVTFSETGLPANLTWEVGLASSTASTTTDGGTDSVAFVVANGTYSYRIYGVSGWEQSTLPYRGSLTVKGSAIDEPTVFYTQVTYAVTFGESGLPSGETFQVTLNGNPESLITDGATDTLSFQAPNGSAPYIVAGISGWSQATLPYHGTVPVVGTAVTEPTLVYTQVTYSVSFSETGLINGLVFSVTLNSVEKSLTSTTGEGTLTFTGLPNGTYAYSIGHIAGWQQSTLPNAGSVYVAGTNIAEPVLVYSKYTFPVEFSESGLPPGIVFQVTVGANSESLVADGQTDTLIFPQPNGTYDYTITTISGWYQATLPYRGTVDVADAGVTETTALFTEVNYTVTYTEVGLPAGTNWSFTLGTFTESSTGAAIGFIVPNGTYAFHVGYVAGYATTPEVGQQLVDGTDLSITVTFVQVKYTVTFGETGLPSGSHWRVEINSNTYSTSTTSIVVTLPNGTYDYLVPAIPGWAPVTMTGSVDVSGSDLSVSVPFSLVTYSVTFTENGLPAIHHPKAWSVELGGQLLSTTGTTITFTVGNGSFGYLVRGPSGYRVSSVLKPEGTINVTGASVPESVTFLKGSTGTISFHEQGLATGTRWCATIVLQICSTTAKVAFTDLTPGTYTYGVRGTPGMKTLLTLGKSSLPLNGTVALASSASLKVEYTFPVTFTESGLPSHTGWKVSVGGGSANSTTDSIVVYLKNGSYSFHIGKITGYVASPASGGFKVTGAALSVKVSFSTKP